MAELPREKRAPAVDESGFPKAPTDEPPVYAAASRVVRDASDDDAAAEPQYTRAAPQQRRNVGSAHWSRFKDGGDLRTALETKIDRVRAARDRFEKLQREMNQIKEADRKVTLQQLASRRSLEGSFRRPTSGGDEHQEPLLEEGLVGGRLSQTPSRRRESTLSGAHLNPSSPRSIWRDRIDSGRKSRSDRFFSETSLLGRGEEEHEKALSQHSQQQQQRRRPSTSPESQMEAGLDGYSSYFLDGGGFAEAPAPASEERVDFWINTADPTTMAGARAEALDVLDLLLDGDIPAVDLEDGLDLDAVVLETKHKAEDDVLPDDVAELLRAFDDASRQQEMLVTQFPVEDVAQRKEEIEAARAERLQAEAAQFAKREVDLAWREQQARQRVVGLRNAALAAAAEVRTADAASTRTRERGLRRQFARAQEMLARVVSRQRAAIRETYGYLELADSVAARRYRVNWELLPRPLELRLHVVRAVKDKLGRGSYVFLVSMYDRLGGRPMRWSGDQSYAGSGGINGSTFPAATRPVKHRGRFNDVALVVDQSVFALAPSRPELRPGNVLVLELFRLADKRHPRAAVVAWTVLPLCTPTFAAVQGKFRLPLLRGERNPNFDTFGGLESKLSHNLEHWVGNVYVEVRHLPRQTLDESGVLRDEHNVELDFINKLLRLPGAAKNNESYEGGEPKQHRRLFGRAARVAPQKTTMDPENARHLGEADVRLFNADAKPGERPWWKRRDSIFNTKGARRRSHDIRRHSLQLQGSPPPPPQPQAAPAGGSSSQLLSEESDRRDHALDDLRAGQLSDNDSSGDEELLTQAQRSKVSGAEVDGHDYDESGPTRRRGDGARFDPAGLGLRGVSARAPPDPHPVQTATTEVWWTDVLNNPKELDHFKFAVAEPAGHRTPQTPATIARIKLRFLYQELFQSIAPDQRSTTYSRCGALWAPLKRAATCLCTTTDEGWYEAIVFAFAFWIRVYVHYVAQWVTLKAQSVAVYGFRAQLYALEMKYQPDQLTTLEEVLLVAVGPMTVLVSFCCLTLLTWCWQRLVGKVGEVTSTFLAAYGLATVLDAVLVLVVDVLTSNYSCDTRAGCRQDYTKNTCRCFEGDAFKLWRRMVQENNGGIVGIFYCALIYTIVGVMALGACAWYLIEVHMNGRILDTYRRLNGDEASFFMPHDFEISMPELEDIIDRAKRRTGGLGNQRRVAVSRYALKDPLVPSFEEISTHVVIYEITLTGARRVHRHFVRHPNGSVTEIFGEVLQHVGVEFAGLSLHAHHATTADDGPSLLDALEHSADQPAQHTRAGFFQGLRPLKVDTRLLDHPNLKSFYE